jgi:nitroreductase
MMLEQAIRDRRSIRAFHDRPVSKETLVSLLETSRWAPSAVNNQPWLLTVATGDTRQQLEARLIERVKAGGESLEGRYPDNVPEEVLRRREELLAGIAKVGEESGIPVQELLLGSYRFYGAPVVIVVSYDSRLSDSTPAGVVAFVTTMLLAAHDIGLGTCWLGMPLAYPETIRGTLQIPDSQKIAAVVALGYPDPDSGINKFRSSRDHLDAFVTWIGFDS